MPKGGYKIIDFKHINLYSGQSIPGVYDAIESANGKATIVANINISGTERNSMWINFVPVGANFEGQASVAISGVELFKIVVRPNDVVSIATLNTPTGASNPGVSDEDGPSASM